MTDGQSRDLDGPVGPWQGALPLAASGIAVVCFTAALALAWMSVGTLLLTLRVTCCSACFLDGLTRGLAASCPCPGPCA